MGEILVNIPAPWFASGIGQNLKQKPKLGQYHDKNNGEILGISWTYIMNMKIGF
jgi:hypothetical protein